MMFVKNKDCPFLRFEYFEHVKKIMICVIFEHINFAINEKSSKKLYDNPNYCASIMILPTLKM